MDISPQQHSVGNGVRLGSPVWAQVGTFQGCRRIKASDSAPPMVGLQERRPEPGLPPPGNDLPDDTKTSVVIVIQCRALGGGLLVDLGAGHRLQDITH